MASKKKAAKKTIELRAPADWQGNLQWYEDASRDEREQFAKEWCAKTFSWNGQTCVVISYLRQSNRVAFYDMDGGEIHWMPLDGVLTCITEEGGWGRATEEHDFQWDTIMSSLLVDEAGDIAKMLFDL